MNDYQSWKKILWRFFRVFMNTYVASFFSAFLIYYGVAVKEAETFDLVALSTIIVPALSAGMTAGWKALREYKAANDYSNWLHKLPL